MPDKTRRLRVEWQDREGYWNLLGTADRESDLPEWLKEYSRLALRVIDDESGSVTHLPRGYGT